jgi:hypothetical protein
MALRYDLLARLEELFELVRETRPHFRPVWIDDPASTEKQLAIHAELIVRSAKRRYPALSASLNVPDVLDALRAWVGFNGASIVDVTARERGRIAARLFGVVFGRKFSANDMRNELAELRETDIRFTAQRVAEASRVPPKTER